MRFLRFSTVAGERGAADAERDVRGFALQVLHRAKAIGTSSATTRRCSSSAIRCNSPTSSTPRSAIPRPTCARTTAMWDFWSLSPESLHQVTILMSDRGLPHSCATSTATARHTYSFINAEGERFWVKFHFKTMQGIKHWTNAEAAKKSSAEPRKPSARSLRAPSSAAISRNGRF